jgi:hypothetical protein
MVGRGGARHHTTDVPGCAPAIAHCVSRLARREASAFNTCATRSSAWLTVQHSHSDRPVERNLEWTQCDHLSLQLLGLVRPHVMHPREPTRHRNRAAVCTAPGPPAAPQHRPLAGQLRRPNTRRSTQRRVSTAVLSWLARTAIQWQSAQGSRQATVLLLAAPAALRQCSGPHRRRSVASDPSTLTSPPASSTTLPPAAQLQPLVRKGEKQGDHVSPLNSTGGAPKKRRGIQWD